ncbi:MAG: BTAD domain-containing putative transcriptional regulator, partial [Acidimicrobiia bacterium]
MEVRILGPLEVVVDDSRLVLAGGRERALLARLVLSHNRVVTSERLAEDLWGEAAPAGMTQTLQVHVSRLRKVLREGGADHVLVTAPPGYLLRVDDQAIDAVRFRELVARARRLSAAGDCKQAGAVLGHALALWRGPALADVLHAPFAPAESARLEEERLAALEDRIEADVACGRHGEVIGELEALTRMHPFRERFRAQQMLALYRSGRQTDALRVYQEVARLLGEELGIEPGAILRGLETAILRHESQLDWRPAGDLPAVTTFSSPPEHPEPGTATVANGHVEPRDEAAVTASPGRMPFVGRDGELRRLVRRREEAATGRGGLVLLCGVPGIGKTRLVEELATEAQRQGTEVAWGSAFGGGWTPPYAPFAQAIESLAVRAPPHELRADLGPGGAPLARLVPALRTMLPELSEPVPLQPDEERLRLLDALAQLLIGRARRAPLMVCLDDLHWADGGTVAMLAHLARFAPRHRILLVGTYVDVELERTHPLAEALHMLRRGTGFEQMRLDGLSVEAVEALLSARAELEVPEAVAAALASETDGNPFLLGEVVAHLVEEGKLERAGGRWDPDLPGLDLSLPEVAREVTGRRLSRLSEGATRLLTAASVFEGSFRFDLVAAVGGLDIAAGLDALDEALAAQLLQPATDPDAYTFSHSLIRRTLYAALSPSRQLRLHRRVAEALAATRGGSPTPAQAGEIAAQYRRCAGLPGAE